MGEYYGRLSLCFRPFADACARCGKSRHGRAGCAPLARCTHDASRVHAGQINQNVRVRTLQNAAMTQERRADAREHLALRFTLPDGSPAVTRDIGPGGMYFLMPAGCTLDRWLSFEYELPETGLRFAATGEVVRTEPGPDGTTGVAVAWHSPSLQVSD
jgi:hypothetical protein